MRARRAHDERGVVAILVAVLAVLLLSLGAMAVDLGNAYVQKHDRQKLTDFAALAGAGGDNLPATLTGATCSAGSDGYAGARANAADQAVVDAAAYLGSHPWDSSAPAPSATQLTDCKLSNGEAVYGTLQWNTASNGWVLNQNVNQLSLVSPEQKVDFGFASVMGFDSVNVAGRATVEIKTPLMKTLPFYAYNGCDYGPQTIAQPSNGHAASGVLLSHGSDNFSATLTSLATNPTSSPPQVPVNVADPNDSLIINGTNLTGIEKVGFFESGTTSAGPEPVTIDNSTSVRFAVNAAGTQVSISHLPGGVTSVEDVWYVRVMKNGQWSAVYTGNGNGNQNLNAPPLTVGTPVLTCGQGSNAGNFGTLLLPWNPVPSGVNGQSDNIAYNIAKGMQHGLAPYDKDLAAAPWTCAAGQDGAVLWPTEGTNCTDTKTGLDSAAAKAGFITGIGGASGLLTNVDSDDFCPNSYPSGTTHKKVLAGIGPDVNGTIINNDILSCYFTTDSVTVSQVSSSTYNGSAVIDQSIYKSPRFVQVPVLGAQPSNGGSNKYEILDFRPAFICDEPASATRLTGAPSSTNGIVWDNGSQLNSIQVIFLNPKALPDPPLDADGRYIPYVGTGSKVPLLVN